MLFCFVFKKAGLASRLKNKTVRKVAMVIGIVLGLCYQ